MMVIRIPIEEAKLIEEYGDAYRQHKNEPADSCHDCPARGNKLYTVYYLVFLSNKGSVKAG